MKEKQTQVRVYLPVSLLKKIKVIAKDDHRSVTQQIAWWLEQWINGKERDQK